MFQFPSWRPCSAPLARLAWWHGDINNGLGGGGNKDAQFDAVEIVGPRDAVPTFGERPLKACPYVSGKIGKRPKRGQGRKDNGKSRVRVVASVASDIQRKLCVSKGRKLWVSARDFGAAGVKGALSGCAGAGRVGNGRDIPDHRC